MMNVVYVSCETEEITYTVMFLVIFIYIYKRVLLSRRPKLL